MAATARSRRGLLPAFVAMLLGGCGVVVAPVAVPVPVQTATPYAAPVPRDLVVSQEPVLRCSLFNLLGGYGYCRAVELPPAPPAYCTRSLARVDCWDTPNPFGYHQREVADGPMRLTPEQEWNRTGHWPGTARY